MTMLTNPTLNNFSSLMTLISRGQPYSSSVSCIILLVMISSFMISQCEPTDYCLQCDDFNRESNVKCATSYKDCGHCKTGFIQDDEDSRLCFAIEILEDPVKDIIQSTGSEVILTCIFNAKVWCVWTKDTNQVVINSSSRYQFLSPDAGTTKSCDCSIRIQHLSIDDIGQWQCQSMADEVMDSVTGRVSHISIQHEEDKLIPTIKLNDVNVSGKQINMSELEGITRRKRHSVEQENMLECHVTVRPSELRWEIDGNVIVGGRLNDSHIHLHHNHLVDAMETHTALEINLTCLVEYDSGQILTSYVIIRVEEDKIDYNEPSSTPKLIESSVIREYEHGSLETLCNNVNFDVTQIRMVITAIITLLVSITVIIFIAIAVVVKTG